ncbi:glycosyltransferase family 2 protein [Sneathiella chinensis]|uniref:Glycosyltransferase 2-like domain-containing protein n=1 Tax=Sneathiella chinensis TaxID=349750 RepID=A0ABQ5U9R4_9PROT|nr:glycosyltransferase family 2 protein [Sneathiella chinensis]GLQ07923.1 hypothetical protein GCM10007924_31450 [Sneathiella chinensis]
MTPEKATPDLSIIIISYNTCDLTLDCLRSVFRQTLEYTFEIILLDNQSTDGSADAIEAEFGDRITLIRSDRNLGFAGGNNEAARLATGRYLLLLNPDTVVLDRAIDKLMNYAAATPDARIWGGRTLFPDGQLNMSSCWSRQSLWALLCQALGLTALFFHSTLFNPERIGGWNREGEREVDIVSGCFLLLERAFWEELGGFDPAFFMYGEEADLCLRARQKGARPRVTSEATIVHIGGASENNPPDKLIRLTRSKGLLIARHFPKSTQKPGLFLLSMWPLSRIWLHKLASFLGRRASSEKSRVWAEVWKRRAEWKIDPARLPQS